jgi:hypothetical protein
MDECTVSVRGRINTVLLPRGFITSVPEMAGEGRLRQRVNTFVFARVLCLVSMPKHLHNYLRT